MRTEPMPAVDDGLDLRRLPGHDPYLYRSIRDGAVGVLKDGKGDMPWLLFSGGIRDAGGDADDIVKAKPEYKAILRLILGRSCRWTSYRHIRMYWAGYVWYVNRTRNDMTLYI